MNAMIVMTSGWCLLRAAPLGADAPEPVEVSVGTADVEAESELEEPEGEPAEAEEIHVRTAAGSAPVSPESTEVAGPPLEPPAESAGATHEMGSSDEPEKPRLEPYAGTFRGFLRKGLSARCKTALCFDFGAGKHRWGIAPLAELPVGASYSAGGGGKGQSALSRFVNNRPSEVSLKGGVKFILPDGWVSVSVYYSSRDFVTDDTLRIPGREFEYRSESIKRPYPGFAAGLLGDLVWVGFDFEELRNTGSGSNPELPADVAVSRAWTITFAVPVIAASRQLLGGLKK